MLQFAPQPSSGNVAGRRREEQRRRGAQQRAEGHTNDKSAQPAAFGRLLARFVCPVCFGSLGFVVVIVVIELGFDCFLVIATHHSPPEMMQRSPGT